MTKNKLIALGIGLILIIILSALLIVLQPDSDQSTQPLGSSENNTDEMNTFNGNAPETNNNYNIPDEDGIAGDNNSNEMNGEDDDQLRQYAESALNEVTLPDDADSITEELLYAHAELYLIYTQMAEQDSEDIDSIQNSAEWIVRERYSWYEFSSEEFGFSFNENDFLNTAEEENYAADTSNRLAVLLDVLEADNEAYHTGQLIYQNIQPYIWHEIQGDAASHYDPDAENEDDRADASYRMFEQDVIEYIGDEYPEYLEGENS